MVGETSKKKSFKWGDGLWKPGIASQSAALLATVMTKSNRNERGPDELRNGSWWTDGYQSWDQESFKKWFSLEIHLNLFWGKLRALSWRNPLPTRMKPHPTPLAAQLALCLYRLAHGCTFVTAGDLFGVAESTAQVIFQDVCKVIVGMFVWQTCLPATKSWGVDSTIEKLFWKLGIPLCMGWISCLCQHKTQELLQLQEVVLSEHGFYWSQQAFHVGRCGYSGIHTWLQGLLRSCRIHSDIANGHILPNRSLNLHTYGEIPFTTVGDSAFPSHSWLLKPFKEGTRVPKERYFNWRLCSAIVVSVLTCPWQVKVTANVPELVLSKKFFLGQVKGHY